VLALVNQPSFNPNNWRERQPRLIRNRAVTDLFEPGSTMKPFTAVAALESGRYRAESLIDAAPGYLRLASYTIRDVQNYGRIDISTMIQKSSNVASSRLALTLEPDLMWQIFSGVGFGYPTESGFPGEVYGTLAGPHSWGNVLRATLSYGYGLSVTPLQLTQAYGVIAADGVLRPTTLLRRAADEQVTATAVFSREVAVSVRQMMERVVARGGTATQAQVAGFRVAGKTGTVRRIGEAGYSANEYTALFAGMAPASRPRLVMLVKIDSPTAGEYYGGTVAAPLFARVMEDALRLLNVAPDDRDNLGMRLANFQVKP
jgi:cell division protein FtsI (penicillin-binding protein 3)